MLETLQFEADDRVFSCHVATRGGDAAESWWWFSVSGDSNRYAPFRHLESDTADDVRLRVIEYYRIRLAPREVPAFRSWQQRRA